MCGRFSTGKIFPESLVKLFDLASFCPLQESFNVAPTLPIPAIRERDGRRHLDPLRWGLIPSWAKDQGSAPLINARIETLAEKPSFKQSFKGRRCIIPAGGFYEWPKIGKRKQPYFILRADRRPMAFAGIWDAWVDKSTGEVIESCAIITTPATPMIQPLHDRMPVILDYESAKKWLDGITRDIDMLRRLLEEGQGVPLEMYPVSEYVNSVRNEGEKCIERIDSLGG